MQHKALQQQEFLRINGVASRLLEGAGGAEPQPCPAGRLLPCSQQKLQAVFHRVAAQRFHLQGRAVQFQRGAARKQRPHLCGEGFVQKIQRPSVVQRSSACSIQRKDASSAVFRQMGSLSRWNRP